MEKTVITWSLHDYCKAQCDYCPINSRGGPEPRSVDEYIRVADLLINSYTIKQQRKIDWIFNGGEPLDLDYLPQLLKFCKQESNHITLHTNGGRLWLDWWAIEPYIDHINLTFHFWQNPALIKYITQTFLSKNKNISITSPIRYSNVDLDLDNVRKLEETIQHKILRTILYVNADRKAGLLPYSNKDLEKIDRANGVIKIERPLSPAVEEKKYFQETTWSERYGKVQLENPSFTGQLCNAGVERLSIGAQGWVSGSLCNNQSLGNIWNPGWIPSEGPQVCTMRACVHHDDRLITKFPLPAQ